jgi:cytochrome P450
MNTSIHRTTAHVPTPRASRYLTQLSRHIQQIDGTGGHRTNHGGGTSPASAAPIVDYTDTEALIDFGIARCRLNATADALAIVVEADAPDAMDRVRQAVTHRLETISRRDGLTIAWQEQVPAPADPAALLGLLLEPAGRAGPWPLYAAAHRLGPVLPVTDSLFMVSGYDAVNQVLRDPGFGLPQTAGQDPADTAPEVVDALRSMSRSILRANPPEHGRMRSLMSKVFTPRRVAALRPAIEAAVDIGLDRLTRLGADGRTVDFMDAFAFPLPISVICELLGVPDADRGRFRPLAADLTEALELTESLSPSADAAARELLDVFTALVAERRAHPADDLIGALVAARDADDDSLSETELLANLILLLVAGFETTTGLLGAGVAELLADPALLEALRTGEIEVSCFVEEVLRVESPVQVTTRVARAGGLTVADVPVSDGCQLILLIGAANRDPSRYREPDRFDPSRRDTKPLSFGAGPHICLGNALARLEAEIAFARLVERFPGMTAAPDAPPTRHDRLVLRGYETLPVIVSTVCSAQRTG